MSNLDEVRKAYDELSDEDKKVFSQSIAEPAPESAAEKDSGTEEGASAEDREKPVPEAEHAEKGGEETDDDKDTAEPEPAEKPNEDAEWHKNVDARLSRIEEALGQIMQQGKRTPAPADDATADRLKKAEQIYS